MDRNNAAERIKVAFQSYQGNNLEGNAQSYVNNRNSRYLELSIKEKVYDLKKMSYEGLSGKKRQRVIQKGELGNKIPIEIDLCIDLVMSTSSMVNRSLRPS